MSTQVQRNDAGQLTGVDLDTFLNTPLRGLRENSQLYRSDRRLRGLRGAELRSPPALDGTGVRLHAPLGQLPQPLRGAKPAGRIRLCNASHRLRVGQDTRALVLFRQARRAARCGIAGAGLCRIARRAADRAGTGGGCGACTEARRAHARLHPAAHGIHRRAPRTAPPRSIRRRTGAPCRIRRADAGTIVVEVI